MEDKKQEPVAYINIEKRRLEWAHDYMSWDTPTVVNLPRIPLYTTPQQRTWVGLSTIQILDIYGETLKEHRGGSMPDGQIAFAKAIEQALKERNT